MLSRSFGRRDKASEFKKFIGAVLSSLTTVPLILAQHFSFSTTTPTRGRPFLTRSANARVYSVPARARGYDSIASTLVWCLTLLSVSYLVVSSLRISRRGRINLV